MRILVTGHRGFIGGAVCARLRRDGHRVTGFAGELCGGLPATPQDVVVHLAGHLDDWLYDELGTLAVTEHCRRVGAGLLLASSAAVYAGRGGASEGSAIGEGFPAAPRTPYGISKLLAESLVRAAAEAHGLRALILRLFNPYGAGQTRDYLVPTVVHCVLRGEPLRLRSPQAVRDFVHVDDVAEAFARGVAALSRCAGEVLNLGTGAGHAVREIVAITERLVGRPAVLEAAAGGVADADVCVADPSRMQALLGWRPGRTIEEGLRGMIEALGG